MRHKTLLTSCMAVLVLFCAGNAMAEGECDCEITPTNMTITRGTNLEFDVTVTNNTDQGGRVKFGGKITMPNDTTTGWVYGPTDPFWVAASGEVSGHKTYSMPSIWPVGSYTYHGYVFNNGNLYGECEFDFVVVVAACVPKTGQTTCYTEWGTPEECAGTGQDGDLQKGKPWPNPRFTDNGDGTVADNMTGLIWLKNAECFGQSMWQEALLDANGLADPQCGLNDGSSVGDWRLPNVRELNSLTHFGYYGPALPNTAGTGQWSEGNPFTDVRSNYYWSATTSLSGTGKAWWVLMNSGSVGTSDKLSLGSFYFWPVRGPE